MPLRPVSYTSLYRLYEYSDVLRPIVVTLKNEIFRTGLTAQPKFAVRCGGCGKEFQSEPEPENYVCAQCGSPDLERPNPVEEREIEAWLRRMNLNGQSLREIGKECEKDTEIVDDAWIVCIKQYVSTPDGYPGGAVPVEFLRVDPRNIRLVVDKRGKLGGKFWVCLRHRSRARTTYGNGKCSECGAPLHDVHYVSYKNEGDTEPDRYYVRGEVLHWSKYDPSLTYGSPPLITLWQAAQTLGSMGKYVHVMFQGQRVPRRFIWVVTKNRQGLDEWWAKQEKQLAEDPGHTPIIGVEPGESKEGMVGVVDAMDSLRDLQFLDHKKDLRERISAFYGVSNVFQADVSAAGGLSNESRQIMVTDRAVEFGRGIFKDKVFPWICNQMGWTDFIIDFDNIDERDELTRLNLQAKRIANMNQMVAAGFSADMRADGSFVYSGAGERVRAKEPGAAEAPHLSSMAPPETQHEELELKACHKCGKALVREDIGAALGFRDDGKLIPAVWCRECSKGLEVKAV